MGISELACRGRQEAWKWLERMGVAGRTNGRVDTIFANLTPTSSLDDINCRVREGHLSDASRMLLDYFRGIGPRRFFEGAMNVKTLTLLKAQMPGTCERASATAVSICQKHFDLLGYRELFYGDPVEWHLDPISGRRAPCVHWSRLDPLDPAAVGDSKIIWELNRHQWLVHLGQAYLLTGDERYAESFAGHVRDWVRANPPGMGINWASSLEVALRLISWCWALFLFRDSQALSAELFISMLEGIRVHASHVERYLSYYFSPNTHLTGEALGLYYAGVVFPELRDAGRWRALGERILVEQSERQVFPDGVYFEQSTCYQRYTVETYLHFLILAQRNGVAIPDSVGERIQQMLDFLLAIRRPDGSIPQIGDSDGGWLLPLATRAPDDFRGIFSTAGAFFNRPDYSWAAGGLAPETLWLLGPSGQEIFDALCPAPPAIAPSRLFAEGGYAVMRSGWDPHAHYLIFDVGPLGCSVSGGHGHSDLLSIQCSVFGKPILVDPGTYCYTAEPEWRDFFRGTAAHSTVTVDDVMQAIPAGPFNWRERPRARLRRWLTTDSFDLVDADHDAYLCLSDPVVHRRRVAFIKPRYWVLLDDLEGAAEHRVELRFQFSSVEITVDETLWARAHGPGGCGLLIRAFATVPLEANVLQGHLAPIRGWNSPDYGQRLPSPVLTYSTLAQLPLRIVTVLLPTKNVSASPPKVSALVDRGPGPLDLVFGDGEEIIRFDDRDVFLETGNAQCAELSASSS